MTEFNLSKTICIRGSDGEYYRHTVKYTPPNLVTVTKTERSWLFWKKEVQEQVDLTETAPSKEAIAILEEQVYAIVLAHASQYDKDFDEAVIDETGATFDGTSKQTHDFSLREETFQNKFAAINPSADAVLKKYVIKHFKTDDVQGTHLFNRFANRRPFQFSSLDQKDLDTSSRLPEQGLLPSPSLSPRVNVISEEEESEQHINKARELDEQLALFQSLVAEAPLTFSQQNLLGRTQQEFH